MKSIKLLILVFGLIKLASAQQINPVWINQIGGPEWDIARTICINNKGDLLITGAFSDSITINGEKYISEGLTDVFTAKFTSDGEFLGAMTIGGEDAEYPMFSAFEEKEILVIKYHRPFSINGQKIDSVDHTNYLVAWFDLNGKLSHHQILAGKNSITINDMQTDKHSSVYLCGGYTETLWAGKKSFHNDKEEQSFVAVFSNKGKEVTVNCEDKTDVGDYYACYPEQRNQILIAGVLRQKNDDCLYYSEQNNGKSKKPTPLLTGKNIEPKSINKQKDAIWITASYKNFYIVGIDTTFAKGQKDIVLVKVPTKKGIVQTHTIGGYGNDIPLNLNISGEQVLLAGSYADTLWYNESDYHVAEELGSDMFLATYNENNKKPITSMSLGGLHNDFPCAVATSEAGVFVLGQFNKSLQTTKSNFSTSGSYDVFVGRFENCGAKEDININVKSHKNKGTQTFTLTAEDGYSNYQWGNYKGYGQSIEAKKGEVCSLTATDRYGCVCKGEINLSGNLKSININNTETDIDNLVAFNLYPTIVSDKVYWQPGSSFPKTGATIKIIDAIGRTVLVKDVGSISSASEKQTLNMGRLMPGQYLIEITGIGFSEQQKVIVK
jgi:hypothetical protein